MDIVRQLVARRKELGLTQTDLARMLNLAQPTISDFERNGNPTLLSLEKYARALGASLELKFQEKVDNCPGRE